MPNRLLLVIALLSLAACSGDPTESAPGPVASEGGNDAVPSWRDEQDALGRETYERACASCHETGDGGAPLTGRREDWSGRSDMWQAVLFEHAKSGYLEMPGKAVRINRSNRGKPALDASAHPEPLHFSMAKSEDRLLLGFATSCHLGVDLEPLRRKAFKPLGVARRYFSAAETAALAALQPSELDFAFLRTWACKEAVVKASGQGIANQLCRFTVETRLDRPAAVLAMDDGSEQDWTLSLLRPDERFLGALAAPEAGVRVNAFRLLPAETGSR